MANRGLSLSHNDSDVEQVYTSQILNESPHPLGSSRITDKYTFLSLDINLSFRKWLGTRLFRLLAHKRPSPFFYTYPHKKSSFTLINDFVVES